MFFFSSIHFGARMCPFVCGTKTIDFPSSSKRGERKNAEEEEGEVRRSRARKKDEENRVACTLSRARSQNSFARVRRDPSGFSVFRGDWYERQRINFVHRRDLSSPCLVSSKSLPGRTKEEEKRALVYAENESTTKTHETPSFFLEPKQTTDRHRDHGAGCSLHRLPGSVPRGAKRRRASRRRRTVVGRRRLGRDFVLLFVLVGARRVGTIGLVREREKRNKVRNHSKSTQNTSEREKKECGCIGKTRENERERERVKRERGSTSYGGASLLRVRLRRLFRVDVCKERGLLLLLLLHYYLRARARSRVVPSVPKGKRALLLLPFSLVPHAYHFSFSFFNALMKP